MKEPDSPKVTVTAAEDLRLGRQRVPLTPLPWPEQLAIAKRRAAAQQFSAARHQDVIQIGLAASVLCARVAAAAATTLRTTVPYASLMALTADALAEAGAQGNAREASALLFVRCGQAARSIPDIVRTLNGTFPSSNDQDLDEAGWDSLVVENTRPAQEHTDSTTLLLLLQENAGSVASAALARDFALLNSALVKLARSCYCAFRLCERLVAGQDQVRCRVSVP